MIKWTESTVSTVGKGRAKADFLEVMVNLSGIEGGISGQVEKQGIFDLTEQETGSSIDEPFGWIPVSQELSIRNTVALGNMNGGGIALCHDDRAAESGVIVVPSNSIDNVLAVGEPNAIIGTNALSGMAFYGYQDISSRPMGARSFVGTKIYCEIRHYLTSSNAGDRFEIGAKWVFKKVKMTKTEYMEKLAIRAYL